MTETPDRPAPVSLQLLGGVALHGGDPGLSDRLLTQSKAVGLLAYLLLSAPGAFQRRDRIIGLLWPEQDQPHARTALRKTIHVVRAILGDHVLVNRGDEDLAVNHEQISCDVVELRNAVERRRLAAAVEMYKGELMPGFYLPNCSEFESWIEDRRRELHELAVTTCMDLARLLESEANGTQAGAFARKAARLAGSNERVLRRSMTMLDRLGDRAGALELYDEFAKKLRQQLEALPSPETIALADALRSGKRIDDTRAEPRH